MITPLLQTTLEPAVRRRRLLRKLGWWTLAFLILAALTALLRFAHGVPTISPQIIVLASLIVIWVIHRRAERWQPDYRALARQIEEKHPDLHAALLTAVEQAPDPVTGKLHFLQQRVIADVVARANREQWIDSTPRSKLILAGFVAISAYVLLAACIFSLRVQERRASASVVQKDGVEVTPGDVSIERGSGLVILATFHTAIPTEATLVLQPQNQSAARISLVRNLDDPIFGGGLPEVDTDLTYHVEYAGKTTRDFTVRVFEHPRLERADATLRFPEYTRLPEKLIPDTRRVSAVEGTKLEVAFKLNKPVKSAALVARDGTKVPLGIEGAVAALRDFPVRASQTYELRLEDAENRTNKVPAQFIVEALPNRRPELKFTAPKGDQRVSPIEEVAFRAEAWDDFGLARYGLTVKVAGRDEQDIELGTDSKPDERRELAHLLKLEDLGAKTDELVSWFLWAEDVGPDGKPRRTASDMFFGEVRPFEEIYRQGDGQEEKQQQQQGGGGAGAAATKLADLQKQIISATWNLKRAEDGVEKSPTDKYLKDEPVVRDSQGEALKQATALGEKVEDPKSRALIDDVAHEMQAALDQLVSAEKTAAHLPEAVAAEQSAYSALLKLAAHEFRVTRSQRGQQGRQGQQRNQQQLDQLELKEDKQRYETKREAAPMQNEQQREQLTILNRLKELAQRQQDINERVKELQTALQETKTEKEKEEIRRQLKRLREEEQQLVADIDETRQKMEQSSQQSQLADERRKLDDTRGEAQKAAEALEQQAASQALASGTRAARNLEQMRDDFRKKTSGQFNDDMRQMRTDARQIAEQEEGIADKLKNDATKTERRTLDGSTEREQLAQELEKQQSALGNLTEQMKRVSEQAEAAEPLLAKELYDAFRKNAQAGTDKKLEMTAQLAQRGYNSQAEKFEEKARQEIDELKTGVERAAESVLGDEAEALRQARTELDTLTAQLNREIARARPDLADNAGKQNDNAPRDGKQSAATQEKNGSPGDAGKDANPQARPAGQKPGDEPTAQSPGGQPGERGERTAQNGNQSGNQPQQPRDQANQSATPGSSPGQGSPQSGQTAQNRPEKNDASANQPGAQPGAGGNSSGRGDPSNQTPDAAQRRPASRLGEIARPQRDGTGLRGGNNGGGGGGDDRSAGPLTGENFAEWSDRLRNVEEMVDNPALRREVARVRELAKGVRVEFKRHSVEPNWEMVKTKIGLPLAELRNSLTEELARRASKENLVPIDRDPVPTKYAERVRRYYEDLGRSR